MERTKAYRQLLLQIIVTLLCAVIALCAVNFHGAYSALLGGLTVVLPTYVFILCVFHYSGARAVGKMMGSFFIGEIGKLASMAVLMIVAFKYFSVQPAIFLISFLFVQVIAAILGFWWAGKATTVEA